MKTTKPVTLIILVILLAALLLNACSGTSQISEDVSGVSEGITQTVEQSVQSTEVSSANTTSQDAAASDETLPLETVQVSDELSKKDLDASWDSADATIISFEGDSVSITGEGATVNGSIVTIQSEGTYLLSGTLNDGQVIVDSLDEDPVKLVLIGVSLTSTSSAPIVVLNADKTILTLAEGTQNTVTDGAASVFADAETDEPNAAIFSKDDLTINGTGTLLVNANYNNGITSNDDLKIVSGTITMNAVANGIKGKESVVINAGSLTISAGADGIKSSEDTDLEKGYIYIAGGTLNINAGLDGIQAETNLLVTGGDLTIITGDGSSAWGSGSDSQKGIKAGGLLEITGGSVNIDAADDGINSNDTLTITAGAILLSTGDDGIHADQLVEINGGEVIISNSSEGIESENITINDGIISITSSDDGFNVVLGTAAGESQNALSIHGGNVYINSGGDSLDSNNSIYMTGGVVVVNGPTMDNNGGIDYDGEFMISGGYLVVASSSGMAEAPGTASTQNSVLVVFSTMQAAGTLVHIESESGESILTFAPTKEFQMIVLSSPDLETGSTYTVSTGGQATGTVVNGLYGDGTYSGGSVIMEFTISSATTGISASGYVDVESIGGNSRGNGRH